MNELGKPFTNKSDEKKLKTERQCKNAACEQKTTSEKEKFGSNKKLGMDCKNHLGKKIRYKKIEKTVKIKVKLPHVNTKPLARKRIFLTLL